jgi:dephospho-CoA kinase
MPKRNKRLIIGLTGNFGSGKTTVAKIFKLHGARVIDADKIAHTIIKPGSKAYKNLVSYFGRTILEKNRQINRQNLAKKIFSDRKALIKLNKITHPEIISGIKKEIKASQEKIVVLDAPLLIESGLDSIVDKIIVVKIKKDTQLKRLASKYSRREILERIKAQMPQEKKLLLADFIIDNSGTITKTKKQVSKIRRLLWRS